MEYTILEEFKEKCDGLKAANPDAKRLERVSLIIVCAGYIGMLVGMYKNCVCLLFLCLLIILGTLVRVVIINHIIYKNDSTKKIDIHAKKMECLFEVLSKHNIKTRKNIEDLIKVYEQYISNEDKKRNAIGVIMTTAISLVMTWISEPLDKFDVASQEYYTWFKFISIVLIAIFVVLIILYTIRKNFSCVDDYEKMVKNLRECLIYKAL